jgi:hypothetical protein
MWGAIQASGRAMVLTVEGHPDIAAASGGGYGNALRVGHDIRCAARAVACALAARRSLHIVSDRAVCLHVRVCTIADHTGSACCRWWT